MKRLDLNVDHGSLKVILGGIVFLTLLFIFITPNSDLI